MSEFLKSINLAFDNCRYDEENDTKDNFKYGESPVAKIAEKYLNDRFSKQLNIATKEVLTKVSNNSLKFANFNSLHEAYGVLAEEVDEFFEEVRNNNRVGARREAIDVAAVMVRLVAEMTCLSESVELDT